MVFDKVPHLSVIVPRHNDFIEPILDGMKELLQYDGFEVIVVDSSEFPLQKKMMEQRVRVVYTSTTSRGERLQIGINSSAANVILLYHPRSVVDSKGIKWLFNKSKSISVDTNKNKNENENEKWWGGFTHKFNIDHWLLRITSWYSNNVRSCISKIIYLDHCIFFTRNILLRPIPPVSIFEDTELSLILRESCKPIIVPYISETSAIRFQTNGFIKQIILNQWMKILYHIGFIDNHIMNSQYEKGLELNGKLN
jgi:hypothetical protein